MTSRREARLGLIVALAIIVPIPAAGSTSAKAVTRSAPPSQASGQSAPVPAASKPDRGTDHKPDRSPEPAAELARLLARFSAAPGIFARFREEKHLALLDMPLVNEGTIHFAPPGRLARHTERPLISTLLIEGNRLEFGDADGQQSVDLGGNPVARLFVDSFIMILSGNRSGLERIFQIRFTGANGPRTGPGSDSGWHLTLLPRVAPMNKVIKEITLQGSGITIRQMEIRESSGDWTHTSFTDVDVNHRYDAAEQARVFRISRTPPR
jgi:Outer membrane lipoprotein carrier protein LolA-like